MLPRYICRHPFSPAKNVTPNPAWTILVRGTSVAAWGGLKRPIDEGIELAAQEIS
jgi:hypothetical protein